LKTIAKANKLQARGVDLISQYGSLARQLVGVLTEMRAVDEERNQLLADVPASRQHLLDKELMASANQTVRGVNEPLYDVCRIGMASNSSPWWGPVQEVGWAEPTPPPEPQRLVETSGEGGAFVEQSDGSFKKRGAHRPNRHGPGVVYPGIHG